MKKKLIEVALPLEAINTASSREKSIRHGHPSTMHLWWARRPLAACRAVLFAQLVDDPSSDLDKFPTHEAQEAERVRLFGIIEELVQWENSTNDEVLERARAEIRTSYGGKLPPIYDPFSGGGSIPLEAQRLGLPAYGSDLNPVAVMIGKAMIEIPPKFKDNAPVHAGGKERQFYRYAEGLAEDVKYYGDWMRESARERIGMLYPQVDLSKEYGGGKASVIAWIWSRTVPSPDPAFSAVDVPLVRSFRLSAKAGKEVWIQPVKEGGGYHFEVQSVTQGNKHLGFEGTVGRQGGVCLMSNSAMPLNYIREKGRQGKMGRRLMAVVVEGPKGRVFLPPSEADEEIAKSANPDWRPDVPLPKNPRDFKTPNYGINNFGEVFSARQLCALNEFSNLVPEAIERVRRDAIHAGMIDDQIHLRDGGIGATAYAEAIGVYLGMAVGRSANYWSSFTPWGGDFIVQTFGRQALPMVWDFAEANPFSNSTGNFLGAIDWVMKSIQNFMPLAEGKIVQGEAQELSNVPTGAVFSTDPPYYDNIGYADLSDFFYIWMKRTIGDIFPSLFSTMQTPKESELVATPYRHGGKEQAENFFIEGMTKAMSRIVDLCSHDAPTTIYYAFKQSEVDQEGVASTGWATFLEAVIASGLAVVGTWPVRTERDTGLKSAMNVLASSVVLVCRKRTDEAEIVTRSEFVRALKRELPSAIADLQAANITPADMPQSAIGPGMGVFSRYKAVLESDDSPMSVKTALQLINRELDEYLGGIQGEFDADTRFAITWFEQNGTSKGEYGVADNLARARGISVDSVKHAGIVESAAGKVRILLRDELDDDWDPEDDRHLTVWECLQHLVRQHEKDGISHDTAVLLKKINTQAEAVKDLAYCLYDISANKRKDAKEATAYNALIADWTELTKAAAAIHDTSGDRQIRLDI